MNNCYSRESLISKLRSSNSEYFDFIIIGGGATGLGCALDAVTRGYKTLVIEQSDFGKGSSSKSTKLAHGGVRYLAQGNVALVYEALRERGRLLKNAPHLVRNIQLLIPNYNFFEGPYYTFGLKIYDSLSRKFSFGPSTWISKKESLEKIPNLRSEGLRSGVVYHDGQFDDARLLICLAKSVIDHGGIALNYIKFDRFIKSKNGKILGVQCTDQESGEKFEARANILINASGGASEYIQKLDDKEVDLRIKASQGSHIVVDSKFLGGETSLLIPKTSDGRVLFAIPWKGKLILGTTDVPRKNIMLDPKPMESEIDFILETAGRYLKEKPGREDIKSIFAGIRPLVIKSGHSLDVDTKSISRGHKVSLSKSGLVSISGGKWTTYRKMAEDTIDDALKMHGLPFSECKTRTLPIHGYIDDPSSVPASLAIYGADSQFIMELMEKDPELKEKIHPDFNYTAAEVVWACKYEMARNLEDILARRIRLLFTDVQAAMDCAEKVVNLMCKYNGGDENWKKAQLHEFTAISEHFLKIS